jgi:hypothetical protein
MISFRPRAAVLLGGFLAAALTANRAFADERPPPRAFETATVVMVGSPIGLAFLHTEKGPTTAPLIFSAAQRLRLPRYTPFALEASYVMSYGLGANLLIDAYRNDSLRFHLNIGYFRYFDREHSISVDRLPRNWDMTFGPGAEVRTTDADWVTFDYRVFVPDPRMVEGRYGYLGRQYWDESIKGGMLCVGWARTW